MAIDYNKTGGAASSYMEEDVQQNTIRPLLNVIK
jgi:hypothetical protein